MTLKVARLFGFDLTGAMSSSKSAGKKALGVLWKSTSGFVVGGQEVLLSAELDSLWPRRYGSSRRLLAKLV